MRVKQEIQKKNYIKKNPLKKKKKKKKKKNFLKKKKPPKTGGGGGKKNTRVCKEREMRWKRKE